MVGEFTEVESGKRNDRPALAQAIRACRVYGATLIIAKLDRLARNVAFTSNLMDSGVDFVAVDNPTASRLTIHILAAVAEDEALRISSRYKGRSSRRQGAGNGTRWSQGVGKAFRCHCGIRTRDECQSPDGDRSAAQGEPATCYRRHPS